MNTILFFKGRYIDCLSDLKGLFIGAIDDDLRRELLGAFQDGRIIQWLDEGNKECHELSAKLKQIDMSLSNQEHMHWLKSIFTYKELSFAAPTSQIVFEKYCQIEDIRFCRLDSQGIPIGESESIKNDGIRFKPKEEVSSLQLYLSIKIVNPDNEMLSLTLLVSDNDSVKFEEQKQISLNTRKNNIANVSFLIPFQDLTGKNYTISLKCGSQGIWSTYLLKGIRYVNIKIEGESVPFCLVEGHGDIKSFYMMRYVAADNNGDPIIYVSYNNILSRIKRIQEKDHVLLRLPYVKEWQYAARGGLSIDEAAYSGSNNVDDVAWYNGLRHAVGLKKPNKYGLYDMSGNVWEMTEDVIGRRRFVCGGCYSCSENECRVDSTSTIGCSNEKSFFVGYRLICDMDVFNQLDDSIIEYCTTNF